MKGGVPILTGKNFTVGGFRLMCYPIYNIHCKPYNIHSKLYIVQYTVHIVHYTSNTLHCMRYIVHYTIYIVHNALKKCKEEENASFFCTCGRSCMGRPAMTSTSSLLHGKD